MSYPRSRNNSFHSRICYQDSGLNNVTEYNRHIDSPKCLRCKLTIIIRYDTMVHNYLCTEMRIFKFEKPYSRDVKVLSYVFMLSVWFFLFFIPESIPTRPVAVTKLILKLTQNKSIYCSCKTLLMNKRVAC